MNRVAALGLLGILLGLVGCGEEDPERTPFEIVAPRPELRPSDGLFESTALQAVVDRQVDRDGPSLVELLNDPDPAVRARAALALGAVQWPGARPALERRLGDPDPGVRRDAAFALGQLESEDGGRDLAQALVSESELEVRIQILAAIGRTGDEAALLGALELETGDHEGARTRALARALLREVDSPAALTELADRLDHPDPEVREPAAFAFARLPEVASWSEHAGTVRAALDAYPPDDPAAMHLTITLARMRDAQDLERLLHWLHEAADWRIRVNVARALGGLPWLEHPGVRPALFEAVNDESEHVGVTAARALTQGMWVPPNVLAEMTDRIQSDPERWRVHTPFLTQIAEFHDPAAVISWTRDRVGSEPGAVSHGLRALAGVQAEGVDALVLEMADRSEPEIRTAAFDVLARRWQRLVTDDAAADELHGRLVRELRDGPGRSALFAAQPLIHPVFTERGSAGEVEEAFTLRVERGEVHVAAGLLAVMAAVGDPVSMERVEASLRGDDPIMRRAAALALQQVAGREIDEEMMDLVDPDRRVDWDLLGSLGSHPRLILETERGDILVRLAPEHAPLTVQTLWEQAESGIHEGVPFHRVEANFAIQGGDVGLGDGSGGPGYAIPSELNPLRARRGVLGMASAGKDTEGSQFFILHSDQFHLDGQLTTFGWVENGFDVLDRIQEGDRVLRIRVEPDPPS